MTLFLDQDISFTCAKPLLILLINEKGGVVSSVTAPFQITHAYQDYHHHYRALYPALAFE
jgi:hypothetical protein